MKRINPNKLHMHTPSDDERAYAHALARLASIGAVMDANRSNKDLCRTLSKDWGKWKSYANKLENALGWKWAA